MSETSKPAGEQGTAEPASGVARSWAANSEQTLLGVAPPIALPPLAKPAEPPPPPPAPAPPRPASSGAIAATRMISVSDAAPVTPPAAAPAPTASPVAEPSPAQTLAHGQAFTSAAASASSAASASAPVADAARAVSVPPQAPPQRPASIGGWQSAGPSVAYQAPSLIETLTSMRSPLADAPPDIIDSAQTEPDATPIFDPPPLAPVAQQLRAPEPQPAAAVAGAATGGWQPVMHTVPIPIARQGSPAPPEAPPAPPAVPEMFTSTALSDDYLRAARDVVRAERAEAARPVQPPVAAPPAGEALANAATLQFEAVPPVRAPLSEQSPTASLPISVSMDSSWRRPEAPHSATLPFDAPRATFPNWRVLLLVAISVLALIAIAAAAFVAVRRFAEASSTTSELRVRQLPRVERAASTASAPVTSQSEGSERDEAELGARAARLVLLGRHADARPLYAELARRNPGAPAYAALERILARARGLER
ncbi:MAG: hypothetical protein ABW217_17815 [Polyangiaceae bacterium]